VNKARTLVRKRLKLLHLFKRSVKRLFLDDKLWSPTLGGRSWILIIIQDLLSKLNFNSKTRRRPHWKLNVTKIFLLGIIVKNFLRTEKINRYLRNNKCRVTILPRHFGHWTLDIKEVSYPDYCIRRRVKRRYCLLGQQILETQHWL